MYSAANNCEIGQEQQRPIPMSMMIRDTPFTQTLRNLFENKTYNIEGKNN